MDENITTTVELHEEEAVLTLDATLIDTANLLNPPRWETVKTRQALLNRMNAVKITAVKAGDDLRKSYIQSWQLQILDDLDEFIRVTGRGMSKYSSDWREKINEELKETPNLEQLLRRSPQNTDDQQSAILMAMSQILAQMHNTDADSFLERLAKYASNDWWNTGKFFGELIGKKYIPKNGYTAYGFKFYKLSKRSKWWRVIKIGGGNNATENKLPLLAEQK